MLEDIKLYFEIIRFSVIYILHKYASFIKQNNKIMIKLFIIYSSNLNPCIVLNEILILSLNSSNSFLIKYILDKGYTTTNKNWINLFLHKIDNYNSDTIFFNIWCFKINGFNSTSQNVDYILNSIFYIFKKYIILTYLLIY